MIIYSVKVIIKQSVENEWLNWMKEVHIKDVMDTGYFLSWEMQKLLVPECSPQKLTYVIRYSLQNLDSYKAYLEKDALYLQQEHLNKFTGKFKASRAVYKVIE